MVRWPTPTAGQNIRVAQAGCRYGVSRTAIGIVAAGGSSSFDVVQQSDPTECGGATQDRCVWTARSEVPWITITSSMPRSGDNPVAFTVAANADIARAHGNGSSYAIRWSSSRRQESDGVIGSSQDQKGIRHGPHRANSLSG